MRSRGSARVSRDYCSPGLAAQPVGAASSVSLWTTSDPRCLSVGSGLTTSGIPAGAWSHGPRAHVDRLRLAHAEARRAWRRRRRCARAMRHDRVRAVPGATWRTIGASAEVKAGDAAAACAGVVARGEARHELARRLELRARLRLRGRALVDEPRVRGIPQRRVPRTCAAQGSRGRSRAQARASAPRPPPEKSPPRISASADADVVPEPPRDVTRSD